SQGSASRTVSADNCGQRATASKIRGGGAAANSISADAAGADAAGAHAAGAHAAGADATRAYAAGADRDYADRDARGGREGTNRAGLLRSACSHAWRLADPDRCIR